jgi:propanol-preferring alcohol dehydrogenase
MKAAVVHSFDKPLAIEDVPKPKADSGEVVVKIETCGLCPSDIHAARGDWPFKPNLPLIPGHEAVGIVESVGNGVKEAKEGDRVAIPWMGYACGSCHYCVSGWETLCEQQVMTGYLVDGGYAEYARANAKFVGKVPPGVDPLAAGPLTCAGVTTYKAVKVSGARSSDLVAIFGVGGLGHLAVQYAAIAGATVVAVDLFEEKLDLAKELGATYTVNALKADPIEEIKKLGSGGADVALCVAVSPKAFEQAFGSLRRGGTVVFVGLPADQYVQLSIFAIVANNIKIVGSTLGNRVDLAETFELQAAGKTKVITEVRKLEQVNEAFEEVETGKAKARLVFDFR